MDGINNKMDPGAATEIDVFKLDAAGLEVRVLKLYLQAYGKHIMLLEKDDIVKSSLGDHVYNQFMDIKKKEWDDYRIQVFPYELNRYLMI